MVLIINLKNRKMGYKEKLKDKRWIVKKDDLMANYRENSSLSDFVCPMCTESFMEEDRFEFKKGDDAPTLHHRFYIKGREPWDYPDFAFEFMHKGCHRLYHSGEEKPGYGSAIYTEKEFKEKEAELKESDFFIFK